MGLKGFVDGSLGSRTAYMNRPYLPAPSSAASGVSPGRGLLREGIENGRFARKVASSRAAGHQTIVHSKGEDAKHHQLETALRQPRKRVTPQSIDHGAKRATKYAGMVPISLSQFSPSPLSEASPAPVMRA